MKLYKGSRSSWRKRVPKWYEKSLRRELNLQPGDLIQDCDGFNHYVYKVEPEYVYFPQSTKNWYIDGVMIYLDNGRIACSCGADKTPATQEEIEDFFKRYFFDDELQKDLIHGGWTTKQKLEQVREYLKKQKVSNSDGTIKKEFDTLLRELYSTFEANHV